MRIYVNFSTRGTSTAAMHAKIATAMAMHVVVLSARSLDLSLDLS